MQKVVRLLVLGLSIVGEEGGCWWAMSEGSIDIVEEASVGINRGRETFNYPITVMLGKRDDAVRQMSLTRKPKNRSFTDRAALVERE